MLCTCAHSDIDRSGWDFSVATIGMVMSLKKEVYLVLFKYWIDSMFGSQVVSPSSYRDYSMVSHYDSKVGRAILYGLLQPLSTTADVPKEIVSLKGYESDCLVINKIISPPIAIKWHRKSRSKSFVK